MSESQTATLIDSLPMAPCQQKPVKNRHSPWLMWAVTIGFVFFQFFLQLSAGVMNGQLMKSFHLSALGTGFLASSFYFVYVLLQTPAGMLVDRFGPRRLLGGGGLVCAMGCLLFASSHHLYMAFSGRLLMGAGASFAFVSSLYLVAQWFPEQRFAIMVGLAETVGMVGTLVGNVCLASILTHTSWRSTMIYSSGIALLLGALCYFVVRDKPDEVYPVSAPQTLAEFYQEAVWVIKHQPLWINGLYAGLLFSVVTVFAALWALPFLILHQHTTLPIATFESALIFVGIAIGSPIMGYIYPKVQSKNYFLFTTAATAALICCGIIYTAMTSIIMNATCFLLLGILCSSYVFNYSLANQMVPKSVQSTCIGFTNTLCVITAPLLQPLTGWLLHTVSMKHNTLAQPLYTLNDYHWALSIIPISLIIAALMALYLPTPILMKNSSTKN
ncbi:MAG: MFS transporter [Gammaproteobacteria bacterium]